MTKLGYFETTEEILNALKEKNKEFGEGKVMHIVCSFYKYHGPWPSECYDYNNLYISYYADNDRVYIYDRINRKAKNISAKYFITNRKACKQIYTYLEHEDEKASYQCRLEVAPPFIKTLRGEDGTSLKYI